MPFPTVTLRQQRPERRSHPWIYDNEISNTPDPRSGFEDGGVVRVLDSRGKPAGFGYLNRKSKIAIRYLTRDPERAIDSAFWRERIRQASIYRQSRYQVDSRLPNAYRLVHGESDGIPGLIVDVYWPYAVMQFLALGLEPWRDVLVQSLVETLGGAEAGLKGVYERSDSHVRRLEGLDEREGVLFGEEPPDLLPLTDGAATLLADLKHGAKTGLFLDQRENALAAAREAAGRDVLNCFAYTGLFGLRAASAGAASITDVEISPAFCAVNTKQWEANGLTAPHAVVTDNVFDYLHTLDEKQYRTDMIVLDPPAFTKNRASRDGAIRGYNEINRLAFRMLRLGGVLITCSCSHHLSAPEFRDVVSHAAEDAGRSVKVIAQRGQPADHPVLLTAPESEYLKCLILAVD